jgi:thiol-disulfide isomerase/thioredoxin
VPRLNGLAKEFKDSDVEIVSINTYDSDPLIAGFKGRHKPDYPILTEGEATSDAYGVSGFPAIFVIGKDGKIAYASAGLFEKEVETAIRSSLEK